MLAEKRAAYDWAALLLDLPRRDQWLRRIRIFTVSPPDNASVALLLVDVINDLEFVGGDEMLTDALPAARNIASLKRRAKLAGIPAIYVNDNFGKWRSDFKKLISHCLEDNTRGRPIVEILRPEAEDYFVLKPKQSGFFSTSLEILLKHLGAETFDPARIDR